MSVFNRESPTFLRHDFLFWICWKGYEIGENSRELIIRHERRDGKIEICILSKMNVRVLNMYAASNTYSTLIGRNI